MSHRRMAFKSASMLAAGLLVAACGSAVPTVSPTANPRPRAPPRARPRSCPLRPGTKPWASATWHRWPRASRCRVWYPATADSGVAATPYMSDAAWAVLGQEGLWRPATRSRASVLLRLRTTAATDAKPVSGDAPRPVVVLTPGFTWPAASLTVLAADLASHGYIVFTIDPPPGTEPVGSGDATMGARWAARMAAIHATLKLVGEPALAGQVGSMDKDRVAVGGHSFGGIVAFDASLR